LNAFIDEKLVRFTSPPSLKRCDASSDIQENSSLASNCPFAPSVGKPELPPKSSCVTATVVSLKLDVTVTRPSGSTRYGFAALRLREYVPRSSFRKLPNTEDRAIIPPPPPVC